MSETAKVTGTTEELIGMLREDATNYRREACWLTVKKGDELRHRAREADRIADFLASFEHKHTALLAKIRVVADGRRHYDADGVSCFDALGMIRDMIDKETA